jgi:hypothetical protein
MLEVANSDLVGAVNEDEVKLLVAEGVDYDTCLVDFARLEVETEDQCRESQGTVIGSRYFYTRKSSIFAFFRISLDFHIFIIFLTIPAHSERSPIT